MWSKLLTVDSALQKNESLTKKNLASKQGLMAFLKSTVVPVAIIRFKSRIAVPVPVTSANLFDFPRRCLTLFMFSQTQFLVKMGITSLWMICWVQKQMQVTDHHFKRRPNKQKKRSPSQPASSTCKTLTLCSNVMSVQCGGCYTHVSS